MSDARAITGLVLAGGRATRMGGVDKGLIELAGQPMVAHVLAALRPQVEEVVINANRNHEQYRRYATTVVADTQQGFLGPLAGMASGLLAAATPLVVTLPCDSPFVPADLVARLRDTLQAQSAEIAVAHDGDRLQPVFCLLPTRLRDSVIGFLAEGERKIDRWFARHSMAVVDFSDRREAFRNINTPEERAEVERELAARAQPPESAD